MKTMSTLEQKINDLRKNMNAVILAHYYQEDDIQDIADFVGDSLDLARKAAATDADVLIPAALEGQITGANASEIRAPIIVEGANGPVTGHADRILTDRGVTVLTAADHKSQQSVYFLDPDHNVLELCWERPNARELYLCGRGDDDAALTFTR